MTTAWDVSATLPGTNFNFGPPPSSMRCVILTADLTPVSGANQMRFTFIWGTSAATNAAAITAVYSGIGVATSFTANWADYASTPTQVTFGGSGTMASSSGGTVVSDWITLPANYDSTKTLVTGWFSPTTGEANYSLANSSANVRAAWAQSTGTIADASSLAYSGINGNGGFYSLLAKIEVQGSGGPTVVFRRSLSALGTRVGSRQVHNRWRRSDRGGLLLRDPLILPEVA